MSLPASGNSLVGTSSPKLQTPSLPNEPHAAELADKLSKLRCESSTPPPGIKQSGPSNSRDPPRAVQINRTQPGSGYVSLVSTPNSKKSLPLLSDPQLKIFNKPIPPHLEARFKDLQVLYSPRLYQAVSKKGNPGDISLKPKYMGENESEAQLYILVQCEKKVSKLVKRFFSQKHILDDLRPDFRVHVLGVPLTRHSTEDIWVRGDLESTRDTLCGLAIRMGADDTSVMATLGGLIMVTATQKTLYGLTAGHSLDRLRQDAQHVEHYAESSSEDDDSDGDDVATDPEWVTEAELGSDFGEDSESSQLWGPDQRSSAQDTSISPEPKFDLGKVVADSFRCRDNTANHDWALVEVDCEQWMPNSLHALPGPSDPTSEDKPENEDSEPHREDIVGLTLFSSKLRPALPEQRVVAITSHGLQHGTLSSSLSYLMMPPGKAFVETLDFSPDQESKLRLGDSGSWVVNELTGEVFGHVVSTDALGEAYVMPIQTTLLDIQANLAAHEVSLPTTEEVLRLQKSEPVDPGSNYHYPEALTVPNSPLPYPSKAKPPEAGGETYTDVSSEVILEAVETLPASDNGGRRPSCGVHSPQAPLEPPTGRRLSHSIRGRSNINPEAQEFEPSHHVTEQHQTYPYQWIPDQYDYGPPPPVMPLYPRQGTDSGYQTMANTPQASPQAGGNAHYNSSPQYNRGPYISSHSPPYTPPYHQGSEPVTYIPYHPYTPPYHQAPDPMYTPSYPPYAGAYGPSYNYLRTYGAPSRMHRNASAPRSRYSNPSDSYITPSRMNRAPSAPSSRNTALHDQNNRPIGSYSPPTANYYSSYSPPYGIPHISPQNPEFFFTRHLPLHGLHDLEFDLHPIRRDVVGSLTPDRMICFLGRLEPLLHRLHT